MNAEFDLDQHANRGKDDAKEEELKSKTHLALISPLLGLLKLYAFYREEDAVTCKQKGEQIEQRLLNIHSQHPDEAWIVLNECGRYCRPT